MRLPLLGESDPRDEYSPWFSIQNIQLSKKFNNSWEVYSGVKNLLTVQTCLLVMLLTRVTFTHPTKELELLQGFVSLFSNILLNQL